MGRGRSIRRYAPLGIARRRGRADRLNLTVCHRNQRDPNPLQGENRDKASERTGREGVRGGSSRGDHQTDFSCLQSSRDLSNPLTDLNRQREAKWYTFHCLTSENRVHWYLAVHQAKALLFARDLSACWHSQHSVITHCDHSLLPERLRRHLLLL